MNSELDQYKNLWRQKQASRLSPASELLTKAGTLAAMLRKKQMKQILVFAVTAITVIYTHLVSSQKIETSQAGFCILLGCSLYYTSTRLFVYMQLRRIRLTDTALEVLQRIKKYNRINQFLLTEGQLIYVIILSTGVYLYLLPVIGVLHRNLSPEYISYIKWVWITYILWAVYHTFYIKRKEARQEAAKISNIIASLENNTLP
jgi:hypothetical protein